MQAVKKRKISDITQDMCTEDEDLMNLMVYLKSELDDIKREKKEYFNKVMLLSKNLGDATRKVQKIVKSNRDAIKAKEKLRSDNGILKVNYLVEKQLKESYRSTVEAMEAEFEMYDNRIIELQIELEDSGKDNLSLLSRLKDVDENTVSQYKADSHNLCEIKQLLENADLSKSLQTIKRTVSGINELVNLDADWKEDGICVICKDRPSKIAFTPCGHHCVCEVCYSSVTTCPYCREESAGSLRIFTV